MANSNVIHAEIREDVGKGASRRLRHQGKIPAVLYGGDRDPASLTLNHDPMLHATENESFFSSILEIQVADGRTQNVVVRDIHYHPYKQQIMHFDFMRVSADEQLRMSVPIHYTHEAESPAGKESGVIIQHLVTEVEVSALPANLPEYLEMDLSKLDSGDVVMMSDLILPEGVVIPELSDDEDVMIANTSHVKASQGTGAAAAEEAAEAELEAAAEAAGEDDDDTDGDEASDDADKDSE